MANERSRQKKLERKRPRCQHARVGTNRAVFTLRCTKKLLVERGRSTLLVPGLVESEGAAR